MTLNPGKQVDKGRFQVILTFLCFDLGIEFLQQYSQSLFVLFINFKAKAFFAKPICNIM